ncbi:MAG: galactokinase [Bacteroidota bacterium]
MKLVDETIQQFRTRFSVEPEVVVAAPGRVNMMGEHTDYNEGYVLPAAIDRYVVVAVGKRGDRLAYFHSVDYNQTHRFFVPHVHQTKSLPWANYPKGVLCLLRTQGLSVQGMNFCFQGNIPQRAGLSSSAAVEVASAMAFARLFDVDVPPLDLVQLCQRAENDFVGVQCGIMDQFIAVLGKKHHALFVDCRNLHYEFLPLPKSVGIVICDTRVKRELTRSQYNTRRLECEEAVKELSSVRPGIRSLRDVSLEAFLHDQMHLHWTLRKRCRHVISENDRVVQSVKALGAGDVGLFGKLMVDSHVSLRNDYEVSSRELDAVVDIAMEVDGVYGARMTGAGFGGSVICLVQRQHIDMFGQTVRKEYSKMFGIEPAIYACSVVDGAHVVKH